MLQCDRQDSLQSDTSLPLPCVITCSTSTLALFSLTLKYVHVQEWLDLAHGHGFEPAVLVAQEVSLLYISTCCFTWIPLGPAAQQIPGMHLLRKEIFKAHIYKYLKKLFLSFFLPSFHHTPTTHTRLSAPSVLVTKFIESLYARY